MSSKLPMGEKKLQVTVQVRPKIWELTKRIAQENGATINFVLERVLIRLVNEGEVPGLEPLRLDEYRSNEKYGPATPVSTYDGEDEKTGHAPIKGSRSGRVKPSVPNR